MSIFRVKLIPDDTAFKPLVLCDSPNIATANIRLNHRPVYQFVDFAGADYSTAFFRGNRRNQLTFDAVRAADLSGKAFASPSAALIFAFTFAALIPGLGTAEVSISDNSGAATFFLHNCAVESADLTLRGVRIGKSFNLSGGEISTTL